ncbi:MAG: alpha/beta fold hydrolase [Deltaproteobacteria bacterium]
MPTFRTSANLTLGYRDLGHGAPVLFLHAFPLSSEMWRSQLALFAPERRVVAVDFPGFGQSPAASGALSMREYARAVAELSRWLGLGRFSLVGLSMGGYAALELASLNPELLTSLVLADTRAGADSAEGARDRLAMADRALREGVSFVTELFLPRLLSSHASPDVVRLVRRLSERASPQGVAAAQRAMAARVDHHATLERLRCPALVVCGSEDSLTVPAESERMARALPQGRLELLRGVGHLTNLEADEAFNRALVSFLDS